MRITTKIYFFTVLSVHSLIGIPFALAIGDDQLIELLERSCAMSHVPELSKEEQLKWAENQYSICYSVYNHLQTEGKRSSWEALCNNYLQGGRYVKAVLNNLSAKIKKNKSHPSFTPEKDDPMSEVLEHVAADFNGDGSEGEKRLPNEKFFKKLGRWGVQGLVVGTSILGLSAQYLPPEEFAFLTPTDSWYHYEEVKNYMTATAIGTLVTASSFLLWGVGKLGQEATPNIAIAGNRTKTHGFDMSEEAIKPSHWPASHHKSGEAR